MKNKNCEVCNRTLTGRATRFCSKSCLNKFYNTEKSDKRHSSLTEVECKVCGKKFKPNRKGHTFCSDSCRWKAKSSFGIKYQKVCLTCGKEFVAYSRRQKYCNDCSAYARRGHQRIAVPLRKKVYELQDCKCWLCGQFVPFSETVAHHLDGEGQGPAPDNSVENLAVLHKLCHKYFHQLFLNFKDGRWYITGDVLDVLGLEVKVNEKNKGG